MLLNRGVKPFVLFLALLLLPRLSAADADLQTRPIEGRVRFRNADPAVLRILDEPGRLGMASVVAVADSLAPRAGLRSSGSRPATNLLENRYQILAQAGTDEASAIAYGISFILYTDQDRAGYFLSGGSTPPLVRGTEPVVVDVEECMGVLELVFVDADGNAIAVDDASGGVFDATGQRGVIHSTVSGSTRRRILVPGGVEATVVLSIRRGSDVYSDEITDSVRLTTTVPCDGISEVRVTLPGSGQLGSIRGTADILGEFEWSTGPTGFNPLRGRTAVLATGPSGNRRYALLTGDNLLAPASGDFDLARLVPTGMGPDAVPWRIQAEFHIRTNAHFTHVVTPALGEGGNPGVSLAPGERVDLGETFVIDPGHLAGAVRLVGPVETPDSRSVLRGLIQAGEFGSSPEGIPNGVEANGIHTTYLTAHGVPRVRPGDPYSTAGGRVSSGFDGAFDEAASTWIGRYDLPLGGLRRSGGLWKRDELVLSFRVADGPGRAAVTERIVIEEPEAPDVSVQPASRTTGDVEYGFGEVCVRFRSRTDRFYLARVTGNGTALPGLGFGGQTRSYRVTVEDSYGPRISRADAALEDVVTMALPEGDYILEPAVNSIAPDGSDASTELLPIPVRVRARERVCVEACLRLEATLPACAAGTTATLRVTLGTCGQRISRLSYRIDDAAPVEICADCGTGTERAAEIAIPAGARSLVVLAEDELGATASTVLELGADPEPPVIAPLPNLSVVADQPCGAFVTFVGSAEDRCSGPAVVRFEPASGSLFPFGTTQVTATAEDAAGNRSVARFQVTVRDQATDPTELLADEPFAERDGGGIGFNGPWTTGGFNVGAEGGVGFSHQTNSVAPETLARSGGALRASARQELGGRVRTLATPLGADGTTAYVSLVLQPDGVLGQGVFNGFFGLTLNGSNGDDLFVGKPGDGALGRWVLERRGGADQTASAAPGPESGSPTLLVVRCEFRAGVDRFVLHVNPAPGAPEPADGIELSSFDLGSVQQVGLYATGAFIADELRIGRTFEQVVPVRLRFPAPEITAVNPSAIAVAGGTPITVLGSGFTGSDEVFLDGVPVDDLVLVGPGELRGTAPALPAGSHTLQVRRCGGVVAERAAACTGGALPRLYFVTPRAVFAVGGIRVSVVGTNLTANTRIRIAFPSGDAASSELLNPVVNDAGTEIVGEIPPLPAADPLGPYDVVADSQNGRDVLPAGVCYVPNTPDTDPLMTALEELRSASTTPAELVLRSGHPNVLSGRFRLPGASAEERAANLVRRHRAAFRIQSPETELVAEAPEPDADPTLRAVRFEHVYRGLRVLDSSLSVLVSGEDVVDAVGGLLPTEDLAAAGFDINPVLTSEAAVDLARASVTNGATLEDGEIELAIFDRSLLVEAAPDPRLVWRVRLDGAPEELLLDARSGAVVFRNALEHSVNNPLDGMNMRLRDARNLFTPSTPTNQPVCYGSTNVLLAGTQDGLIPAYQGDVNMVATWNVARQAYAFFNRNFGWRSYDNGPSEMKVYAHSAVDNAQWSGGCRTISFRDGWVDYEVMVHELAHGVIGASSQLRYFMQSGALNESYADVMALLADHQAGDVNWTVGENRVGTVGAVRDIPNEAIRFLGQFDPGDGSDTMANDYGNVHANSGIPNFAAYILARTSRIISGATVQPMSVQKILRLKFDAMRTLTSSSGFLDARTREASLAREWAQRGAHGFQNWDAVLVESSWNDVGVGSPADVDRDGVPDRYDNCRFRANPKQEDADRDGVGDTCDNCPSSANGRQEDMDLDGIGDVCDADLDGDGCLNHVDQHEFSSQTVIGRYVGPVCQSGGGDITGFEGDDTDGDGRRNCEDLDDDGDGIPDAEDSCPAGNIGSLSSCTQIRDCPGLPRDWFRVCQGGGCVQYQLRVVDRINPDPTRIRTLDRVRIVNDSLYVAANVGSRLTDAGIIFVGGRTVRNGGVEARALAGIRLELWTQATEDQPARFEAVVADYNPTELEVGQLDLGSFLVFTPASGTNPPTLGSAWHIGGNPDEAANDLDRDGLPDGWEIQNGLNPTNPADAAADLDGDGLSAVQEFRSGADPRSPSSRFGIDDIRNTDAGLKVRVQAPVGRRVRLEQTTSLTEPDWKAIGGPVRMNGLSVELDAGSIDGSGTRFFRLREVVE
jgi:Zn-dependent metalloprotease